MCGVEWARLLMHVDVMASASACVRLSDNAMALVSTVGAVCNSASPCNDMRTSNEWAVWRRRPWAADVTGTTSHCETGCEPQIVERRAAAAAAMVTPLGVTRVISERWIMFTVAAEPSRPWAL